MEEVRKVILEFLKGMEIGMESYFNTEDPSDYFSGNADDEIQHGYDAGVNSAQEDLYNMLKDLMDLSEAVNA